MERDELIENAVNSVAKAMQKGAKRQGYWVDSLIALCNDVLADAGKVIYLQSNGRIMVGDSHEIKLNGVFGRKK